MNPIIKFFHELRNPHCNHCDLIKQQETDERLDKEHCKSCETLNRLNESLLQQIRDLQKLLIERLSPQPEKEIDVTQLQPIQNSKYIPFNVTRQKLEREDRERARIHNEQLKHNAPKIDVEQAVKELNELEQEVKDAQSRRESQAVTI